MDEQLHWCRKHETFHLVSDLYLGMFCRFSSLARLELLLLLLRSLYLHTSLITARTIHDGSQHRDIPIHVLYAHECGLRNHDWHWNH